VTEIGGYFELELNPGNQEYHSTLYRFKSGRASLNFILHQTKPTKVYVPFYACDALLEPFIVNNIQIQFYAVDAKLEIVCMPSIKDDELIVYVNYFDLKRDYVASLSNIYKGKLVVDCTQAYFQKGNEVSWFFNSCRKFFGVADGSDLYVPKEVNLGREYEKLLENTNFIVDHLLLRSSGQTQHGYKHFKKNETLNNSDLLKMSKFSSTLLSQVNFKGVTNRRKLNFNFMHYALGSTNMFPVHNYAAAVPFFYPYYPNIPIQKEVFWKNNIFIPSLWSDCINRKHKQEFDWERTLSRDLLPLPIDHRYDAADMERIVNCVRSY
jgi:hypothetical protein